MNIREKEVTYLEVETIGGEHLEYNSEEHHWEEDLTQIKVESFDGKSHIVFLKDQIVYHKEAHYSLWD